MKETRTPPAKAANLVVNSGNTIYGVGVIGIRAVGSDDYRSTLVV